VMVTGDRGKGKSTTIRIIAKWLVFWILNLSYGWLKT
jgi:Mg-chelatase subunit ChlI